MRLNKQIGFSAVGLINFLLMHHLHCLRRVTSLAEAHEAIVVHGIFAVCTLDQGRGDLTVSSEQVLKRVLISATRESLHKNVVKGLKTKKS